MPKAVHIVKCHICAIEREELLFYPDAPGIPVFDIPKCSSCGTARHIVYAWTKARRADAFSPIEFNGTRYDTRSEWEQFRAEFKHTHGHELHVVGMSPAQKKQQIEDRLMHNVDVLTRQAARCGVDYSARIERIKETAYNIRHM